MTTATLSDLFSHIVSNNPSTPFVTYYNNGTGERTELSAKSMGNWVAKIHFLMMDSLGLGAGNTAAIALEPDWVAVAAALGCWSAGLSVVDGAADVCITTVGHVDDAVADDVFCVDQSKLSRSCTADGVEDFIAAVRPQPDVWATVRPQAGGADGCIGVQTHTAAVAAAVDRAEQGQIAHGARLLVDADASTWLETLALVLAMGGSMVLVSSAGPDKIAAIAAQENAVAVP